jgi:hypothetical protein
MFGKPVSKQEDDEPLNLNVGAESDCDTCYDDVRTENPDSAGLLSEWDECEK